MNSRECRVIIRYRFITEYSWSQFSNKPLGSKKSKAIIFPKILNLLLPYISTGHYTHEGLRTIYHERSSQRKLIPKIDRLGGIRLSTEQEHVARQFLHSVQRYRGRNVCMENEFKGNSFSQKRVPRSCLRAEEFGRHE